MMEGEPSLQAFRCWLRGAIRVCDPSTVRRFVGRWSVAAWIIVRLSQFKTTEESRHTDERLIQKSARFYVCPWYYRA
jgi:hypothetical protein